MYAVMCSPMYWNDIQQAILKMGEQILFQVVENNIDFSTELNTASRIAVKHLIIDISTVVDQKKLVHALMQYKIMNDKTQIIIIAPDCVPGNEIIHNLVTQVHVVDIIAPSLDSLNPIDLKDKIQECIANPGTYKKGIKWVIDERPIESKKEPLKIVEKNNEVERIVIRKQLVGKVVVGLSGTHSRVGNTHLGLSLTNYLRRKGFSVAFLQLDESKDVERFLKTDDEVLSKDGFYTLRGVDYYVYEDSFDITIPYRRNYDFFVLDVGIYSKDNPFIDEYERAHVKGVVTTAREWEIMYLENFLSATDNEQYEYLFNFADQKLFDYIVGNMNAGPVKYKAFRMDMESDLIDGTGLDDIFDEWLKRFVSTQPKTNDKQSFLGKLLKKK